MLQGICKIAKYVGKISERWPVHEIARQQIPGIVAKLYNRP